MVCRQNSIECHAIILIEIRTFVCWAKPNLVRIKMTDGDTMIFMDDTNQELDILLTRTLTMQTVYLQLMMQTKTRRLLHLTGLHLPIPQTRPHFRGAA